VYKIKIKMSFHNNHAELRNRQNILQDLQQQKQQLLQQGTPSHFSQKTSRISHDALNTTSTRRSALEYASSHSLAYFIAQDSQFGNPILPVIPRVDEN